MTIINQETSNFIVTHESEKNTSWINGSFVYVKDTSTLYQLIDGSYVASNGKTATYSATFTSGTANVSITDPEGNAFFSAVQNVIIIINNNTGVYGFSWTISGNLKTLTLTGTKQSFGTISVLTNLLFNSVSMGSVANGTSITVTVIGS